MHGRSKGKENLTKVHFPKLGLLDNGDGTSMFPRQNRQKILWQLPWKINYAPSLIMRQLDMILLCFPGNGAIKYS
jgi:hypothetical protein